MSQAVENAVNAFVASRSFNAAGYGVSVHRDQVELAIRGNVVARRDTNTGVLTLSSCGWRTTTTAKALNTLLSHFEGLTLKSWVITQDGRKIPFTDGVIIDPSSRLAGLSPALGGVK